MILPADRPDESVTGTNVVTPRAVHDLPIRFAFEGTVSSSTAAPAKDSSTDEPSSMRAIDPPALEELPLKLGLVPRYITYVDPIQMAWFDTDRAVAANHDLNGGTESLDAKQDELTSSALLGSAASAALRRGTGVAGLRLRAL